MNALVRNMVLILFVWLMLAGVCLGRQLYLKDGGIIEGKSVWRHGNKVFVKVNRDIIADFNLNEIDLRRTFPKTGSSSRHPRHKVIAGGAVAATAKPAPATVPAVAPPAQKPAAPPTPATGKK